MFDFATLLLIATLASGVIVLIDRCSWRKARVANNGKEPILIEYARSFFPVLLFVFLLRSFVIEPFRIPSGSMKPSLLVGDFILVNKYTYGIRLPVWNKKVYPINEPQHGDVMVFRYPVYPNDHFIKRVIGLPGDRITYHDQTLYVNDQEIKKELIDTETILDDDGKKVSIRRYLEHLETMTHDVYERLDKGRDVINIVVPPKHYFMMGDNRDDSDDSRVWGFVPEENIVGKAFWVWMSWDGADTRIRFERLGKTIQGS